MKIKNVVYTACAQYSDGTFSNLRAFATERAMSNWANAQYRKDNDSTVTVYFGWTDKVYCVYHA